MNWEIYGDRMAIIKTVLGKTPQLDQTVFLAETAAITGDVTMGEHSSAFYGVSARGDSAPIAVGARSNLQDNVVLHADEGFPCTIGEDVSVGHAAVVHGATVGDGALIGMNATVLNGATVGAGSWSQRIPWCQRAWTSHQTHWSRVYRQRFVANSMKNKSPVFAAMRTSMYAWQPNILTPKM